MYLIMPQNPAQLEAQQFAPETTQSLEIQGIVGAAEMLLAEGAHEDWPYPGLMVGAKDFDLPQPANFFAGYDKPFDVQSVTVSQPIDERTRRVFGDTKIELRDSAGQYRTYKVKRGLLLASDKLRSGIQDVPMDENETAMFRASFDDLAAELL